MYRMAFNCHGSRMVKRSNFSYDCCNEDSQLIYGDETYCADSTEQRRSSCTQHAKIFNNYNGVF